jgi:hypothetical protein
MLNVQPSTKDNEENDHEDYSLRHHRSVGSDRRRRFRKRL